MAEMLFGSTVTPDLNRGNTSFRFTNFTCSKTGSVTHIYVYCLVNSNVRVALYSDSGSAPDALLGSGSGAVTSGAYRSIALASAVSVTKDSVYWIADIPETIGGVGYKAESPRSDYYKGSVTYATAWPNPAGSLTSQSNIVCAVQAWGVTGPAGLAKYNGVAIANIAKINGVSITDMKKWSGIG